MRGMQPQGIALPKPILTHSEMERLQNRPKKLDEVLEIARIYWQLRLPVLPSPIRQKRPWGKIAWSEWQKQTLTEEDWQKIERYFADYVAQHSVDSLNFVAITDVGWGYVIFDFDPPVDERTKQPLINQETVERFALNLLGTAMPPVWLVRSGKGWHVYAKPLPELLANLHNLPNSMPRRKVTDPGTGIELTLDIFLRWHILVVPPSVHASGKLYQWHEHYNPATVALGDLGDAVWQRLLGENYIRLIGNIKSEIATGLLNPEEFVDAVVQWALPFYQDGQRHFFVLGLAGILRKHDVPFELTEAIVRRLVALGGGNLADRIKCVQTTHNQPPEQVAGAAILTDSNFLPHRTVGTEDLRRLYDILNDSNYRKKFTPMPDPLLASDDSIAKHALRLLGKQYAAVRFGDNALKAAFFNKATGVFEVVEPTHQNIVNTVAQLVKAEFEHLLRTAEGKRKEQISKVLNKVLNRSAENIAKRMCSTIEGFAEELKPDDLAGEPNVWVVGNGVVIAPPFCEGGYKNLTDLKLHLEPHNPSVKSIHKTDVCIGEETLRRALEVFAKSETDWREIAPLFHDSLVAITGGSNEYLDFFQAFLGYAISGYNHEEIFAVWFGAPQSGKSTLAKILQGVLGDYFLTAEPKTLYAVTANYSGHDVAKVIFFAKRLAIVPDLPAGFRLTNEMVKRLSSRDRWVGRRLYQNPFDFEPTHTFILIANVLPQWRDADGGLIRRVLPLPFRSNFSQNPIKNYAELVLKTEAEGVLAYLLLCYLKYVKRGGLGEPPTIVKAALSEWVMSYDPLYQWALERLERVSGSRLMLTDAVNDVEKWAEESGLTAVYGSRWVEKRLLRPQKVSQAIQRVYSAQKGIRDGRVYFEGLALKPQSTQPEPEGSQPNDGRCEVATEASLADLLVEPSDGTEAQLATQPSPKAPDGFAITEVASDGHAEANVAEPTDGVGNREAESKADGYGSQKQTGSGSPFTGVRVLSMRDFIDIALGRKPAEPPQPTDAEGRDEVAAKGKASQIVTAKTEPTTGNGKGKPLVCAKCGRQTKFNPLTDCYVCDGCDAVYDAEGNPVPEEFAMPF